MIRLESVNRRFGAHLALDDVSFEVQTGQTLGLVGAGGSGKSLILKAICGLMPVDGGRVTVGEDEVTALSETALMAVRSRIGMVFQNYALFDFMNVGANIGFPLTQLGTLSPDEVAARVVLGVLARQLRLLHEQLLRPTEARAPTPWASPPRASSLL